MEVVLVIVAIMAAPFIIKAIQAPVTDRLDRMEVKMEALHELSPPVLEAGYRELVDEFISKGVDPISFEEYKASREALYSKYL